MQDNSPNELHVVVTHAYGAPGRFADRSKGLGQQVVQRLDSRWWRRRGASTLGVAVTAMTNASHAEALAELGGLFPQLIIGQGREARLEGIDACDERLDAANVGVVPDTHESLDERNHGRPLVSGGSAPSAIKAPARGRETVRMVRNFANHQVRRTGECVCW